MSVDSNGEKQAFDFYVYNGKVFYAPNAKTSVTANDYAVLAYINTPDVPVLDPVTQEFSSMYSAVLVIDGKETKVDLNPDETIIDADGNVIAIKNSATELLATYGKAENIKNGFLQANYTLVTYTVDSDKRYTLKLVEKDAEDYTVIQPGANFAVDTITGLYRVVGKDINGEDFDSALVALNDASAIYYPYTDKYVTGEHKYLGIYTVSNIYENFESAVTTGYTYLVKAKDQKVYTLEASILGDKLKEITDEGDYTTDGRKIFYCYSGSVQEYNVDEGGIFSSHYTMNISTLVNSGATLDITKKGKDAVTLSSANLYAYDEENEKYIKLTANELGKLGVTSISTGIISDVVNGCIITKEGEYAEGVKIPESAVLWTFSVSVNGDKSTSSYKQLTLDDVKTCLELIEEKREEGKEIGEMRAIFLTYEDAKGEKQISSIHFEFWTQDANGNFFTHSSDLLDNFGTVTK